MDDQFRDRRKIMSLLESLSSDDDVRGIDAEGIAIETGIKPDFVHEELNILVDVGSVIKFYDDESQHSYYRLAGGARVMCKHENRIPIDGHQADAERATICADCGLFFVTIRESSDMANIEYHFKLTTLEQVMAAAEPILAKRGLRIVSAADSDTITAQKQAEEAAKRRILDAENQRDAVARALDEYLASKRDQD